MIFLYSFSLVNFTICIYSTKFELCFDFYFSYNFYFLKKIKISTNFGDLVYVMYIGLTVEEME